MISRPYRSEKSRNVYNRMRRVPASNVNLDFTIVFHSSSSQGLSYHLLHAPWCRRMLSNNSNEISRNRMRNFGQFSPFSMKNGTFEINWFWGLSTMFSIYYYLIRSELIPRTRILTQINDLTPLHVRKSIEMSTTACAECPEATLI